MIWLIILIVVVVIVAIAWSHIAALKRRDAMAAVANTLGLLFDESKDYSYDEQYHFLSKLCQGSRRYAFNILSGYYCGRPVSAFDYHYETYSTDSKGNRSTHHHYFSFFILHMDIAFPELLISHEGWTSKFAQFFGYDDIDFESAEFSRKFCVRSPDKKFAYDIVHPQMMEYLLANPDLNIEMERHCITLFFGTRLAPEHIEPNLNRLLKIYDLIPDYVMNR